MYIDLILNSLNDQSAELKKMSNIYNHKFIAIINRLFRNFPYAKAITVHGKMWKYL